MLSLTSGRWDLVSDGDRTVESDGGLGVGGTLATVQFE